MNVADDVKTIIAEVLKLEPGSLSPDTRLSELAVDSLDLVEVVFKIEEKFDIAITLEPKDSSFKIKMAPDGTEDVSLDNVSDIIQTVQKIVDAKAA
jgi:acyl carrier protein